MQKRLEESVGEAVEGEEQKRTAPGTVNRELGSLKRAWRLAIQKRRLTIMPHIAMLAEENVRTRIPAQKELDAVIRELPDGLRAAAVLLSIAPWRVREALDLKWRQVDEEEGTIRQEAVEYKSGRAARMLPYSAHPALAETISERRRLTDEWDQGHSTLTPWVFWYEGEDANGRRGALPYAQYASTWARACKRANVADLHVHDLKRYAARALVKAGVDEVTIMRLAGWRSRSMFDRYSIRNDHDLADGLRKLATTGHERTTAPKARPA